MREPGAGGVVLASERGCYNVPQVVDLRPPTSGHPAFGPSTQRIGMSGTSTVISGRRHEARITALQALFEIDTATHSVDEVLDRYLGNAQMPPGTRRFIESL